MSILVNLPLASFDSTAFDAVDLDAGPSLANAYAMMWASQLAYQAGDDAALAEVLAGWRFDHLERFQHQFGVATVSGFHADRAGCTLLAFAGTDPLAWRTLTTDALFRKATDSDIHAGFDQALQLAWPDIDTAIARARHQGGPLHLAGHSLGGAMAVLAALRTSRSGSARLGSVYTFGMPRVGGPLFAASLPPGFQECVHRYVHGDDAVPRMPPPELGYRHVGRLSWCESEVPFRVAMREFPAGSNEPLAADPASTPTQQVLHLFQAAGKSRPGPMGGMMGETFRFLPASIRHHLQDWYLDVLRPGQ